MAKKKPMFIPNPDGSDGYLITLAGCVILAGDSIFGDPTATTPEGRTNAMRMVERTLQEAEMRGFTQSSAVWALMRRNDCNPRLKNLVREAVDLIPNERQGEIMREVVSTRASAIPGVPLVTATKSPRAYEPETDPRALRPGPNGVDPRFMAAGEELERIAQRDGKDAIHKPEHAHLYMTMMRYAPPDLRAEMSAKLREKDLLPEATHVDDRGNPVYTSAQIAAKVGVPVEEIERAMENAPLGDLYTGPVFPRESGSA